MRKRGKKYKPKKDIAKYKAMTDVFAKTPTAIKHREDLKAKRLYWKDKDLDAN